MKIKKHAYVPTDPNAVIPVDDPKKEDGLLLYESMFRNILANAYQFCFIGDFFFNMSYSENWGGEGYCMDYILKYIGMQNHVNNIAYYSMIIGIAFFTLSNHFFWVGMEDRNDFLCNLELVGGIFNDKKRFIKLEDKSTKFQLGILCYILCVSSIVIPHLTGKLFKFYI